MYNFYVFLIILATISPIAAYNRSEILKDISIQNEVMFTSVFILILYGIYQIVNKKSMIPKFKKNDTLKYLIINGILVSIALYMGGMILMRENVFKYKTLQKSIYLIMLVIVAVCVYKQHLTLKTILGLLFILMGAYFIDITV